MKHILNFGAGVNSTALVIEMVNKKLPLDYVIFADTGCELPETYNHITRMKEWFKTKNINFVITSSKYNCTIYDYFFNKRTIPFRKFRDCTDKFKKIPITKFISQFKKEGVIQYIGISSDEKHRIRFSNKKWITFEYPLVEWNIDRKKCIEIIKKEGLEIPVKSGCFMCPFQPFESWKNLLNFHPELYKKSREIEEQNRSYPKNTLTWKGTLKQYEESIKQQKTIKEFWEELRCGSKYVKESCNGFCMT